MTETYVQMANRHRAELDSLPIQWAFNKKQGEQALEALGVEPGKETDIKIVRIPGGGLCTEETFQQLTKILDRQVAEQQALIDADTTGEGFIFGMFDYELANHEYCITHDPEPTLDALGLDMEEVMESPTLKHGLDFAIRKNRYER